MCIRSVVVYNLYNQGLTVILHSFAPVFSCMYC